MNSEVQANTRENALTLLMKQGAKSAGELANTLGISVQAMRRHLRILQQEGLVKASSRALGPGRPLNLWELTAQGHNYFNDGSENFALDLLGTIKSTLAPEMMQELLDQQTMKKAREYRDLIGIGEIKDRLEKLVEIRNSEGFLSDFKLASDQLSWYLNEFTCSINVIAEKYPFVCDQELDLIRITFPDCIVQRVQWRLEVGHSCGYKITPIKYDK